ncbi:MAG: MoaD/ThiS family protein [Chloroflexota bacterium]|nr:MoaD/ThiS family protein [Chloroflexota bacterium]
MTVSIYIPTPFRAITESRDHVSVSGDTIKEALISLVSKYPGFADLLYGEDGEDGEILRHINIYINNQEIYTLEGLETHVSSGDQIAIIPALAGGQ